MPIAAGALRLLLVALLRAALLRAALLRAADNTIDRTGLVLAQTMYALACCLAEMHEWTALRVDCAG